MAVSRLSVKGLLTSMRCFIGYLFVLTVIGSGCAGRSGTASMPKPGRGIAEYREVTRQAHRAVADAVDSLEGLKTSAAQGSPQFVRFDRSFNELELTSIKARARAEAIIARGQNYFDEWKEQLAGATNRPAAQTNYNRLYDQFLNVRQRSGEVRDEFRPFMARLRQFRARLDRPPSGESTASEIDALATNGKRVLKALDSVSAALNEAEAQLHAMRNQ